MASTNPLDLPSLQRLQSAEQNELLDVIDSLRSQGMGDFISLPQLIVCGDQSSGKSSVLEAISGIPFPRHETLCTRFATEVILRKKPTARITASIVPEKGRTTVDLARLKDFQHELKTQEDFKSLFDRAGEAMGFSASGKSFSNDILRVELCGPSHPQLTLVDLPGLIHTATKTQTPGDILLVHSLVEQYLKSPRSIILAVVSAKNDIGNQIILERARKFDGNGRRTLGIITKPDTLMGGSKNEEAFIALARNEDVRFDLGWHVVKNIDLADPNSHADSRDLQETRYFETSNFNRLPSHTVGISFLRSRLSKVLFNQIRTELPKLVQEIEMKVLSTKAVYDKLGPSRAEPEKQRDFLISLSQSFQTICRDAVRGTYEHEFFRGIEIERRLCADIMNQHLQFANNVRNSGATWKIVDRENPKSSGRTREEAIKEACALLKRSRGRELPGLPNPSLVGDLFRLYSKPWRVLAEAHIEKIWETTNKFLELLLRYLTDEDSCEKIQRYWFFPIMEEKLSLAHKKLGELLAVHEDQPMTTNTTFLKNRRAHQPKKEDKELLRKIKSGEFEDAEEADIARSLSGWGTSQETDMDMLAAEEAFDNMNRFYEVAVTLFMDNVPTLAVQLPMIRGLPDIFCPTAVLSMDTEKIQKIAGESKEKVLERKAIEKKLKVLEEGGRICKQYARRVQAYPSPVVDNRVELETHAGLSSSNTFRAPATPSFNTTPLPRLFGNDSNGSPKTSSLFSSIKPGGLAASGDGSTNGFRNNPTPGSSKNKPPSLFGTPSSVSSDKATSETLTPSGLFGGVKPATTKDPTQAKPHFSFPTYPSSGGLFGVPKNDQAKSQTISQTNGGIFGASRSPVTTQASENEPTFKQHSLFSTSDKSTTSSPSANGPRKSQLNDDITVSLKRTMTLALTAFEPTIFKDRLVDGMHDKFFHICFLEKCQQFSPEELRLAYFTGRPLENQ